MGSTLINHAKANVIAYLALFVALGGTSYAAVNLPARSVGTKQLKPNAVTSSKIKNRTLLAADFAPGQLPGSGPTGPSGPPGAMGVPGPKGDKGDKGDSFIPNVTNKSGASAYDSSDQKQVTVDCGPGKLPVGGYSLTQNGPDLTVDKNHAEGSAWFVSARELTQYDHSWMLVVVVLCVG